MNKQQIMGIVTTAVIIGGTIYAIKKYRDSLNEEEPISLDEAKAIVEARRKEMERTTEAVGEALGMSPDEIAELQDEARDEAHYNSGFHKPQTEAEIAEGYDFYDDVDWNRPLAEYITEEDKVLRFDRDSIQALDQFIKMELAELLPGDREYQVMKKLFDIHFEPLNDGDEILYSQLSDYREEFFGESRWNDNVSFGDIITHFARRMDYDIGGGVLTWIKHMITSVGFSDLDPQHRMQEMIQLLNEHKYENRTNQSYGLFGLDFDDCLAAEDMADKTVDGQLTYELEFNALLNRMS